MRISQVSVGIIKNLDGNFCLTKRKSNQDLAGFWEFPGGKVEEGETPLIALIRELEEEIGVVVSKSKLIDTIDFDYEHKKVKLYFYMIEEYQGDILAQEQQEMEFAPLQDLKLYKLPDANYQIIDKLV